jgi:phosphate transport system protein
MESHFEQELTSLKNRLLLMASHAETAVNEAVKALVTRDLELALKVKADDSVIDALEVEIDDMSVSLLAKAPLAGDLRLVTVAMKMSQNLERVGDEASKIAKRARDLTHDAPVYANVDLPRLARLALEMLKSALDAFVQRDPVAARALLPRDREVDLLNKQITQELIDYMTSHNDSIARCLHLITVSRSLERIADHAKNMAEEVVYLCEAQDIRHPGKAF